MKRIKVITLIFSICLVLSSTCLSFADTFNAGAVESLERIIITDTDKGSTVDNSIVLNEDSNAIITMHSDAQFAATSGYAFADYFKLHEWKGNYVTVGVGITAGKAVLRRYKATITIYEGNLLKKGKKISTKTLDMFPFASQGSKQLMDDVTMKTGSTKDISVKVTNIQFTDIYGNDYTLPSVQYNFRRV